MASKQLTTYMKHASSRLRNLLGPQPTHIYREFQYDAEGLRSLSNLIIGEELCDILHLYFKVPKSSTITDAFAGLGGNTISFARHFHHVNAIELDVPRSNMLIHNTQLFNLSNVTVHTDYYQSVIEFTKQDVIFFDPPWGPNYSHEMQNVRLSVNGPNDSICPLEWIIVLAARHIPWIVVKLPINYDIEYLAGAVSRIGSIVYEFLTLKPFSSYYIFIRAN